MTLIAGIFVSNEYCTGPDIEKEDVFSYINKHKENRKEIFLYTRKYIKQDNPEFLDSLRINELTEEQKAELFEDYLKVSGHQFYQDFKESIKELSDKTRRAYEEFKKDTPNKQK